MAAGAAPAHRLPFDSLTFDRTRRGDRVKLGEGATGTVYAGVWLWCGVQAD
jgi:hypothetical protein